MSNPIHFRRAGVALAVGFAFAAVPVAAQASPVDLGTAAPFVVLGGTTVTNVGPSVLNGDLGVSPGTALTGFQFATVNGATHDNDAVAAQAQSDLTTAYDVAAGQPILAGDDLSGSDLGGMTLTAGAYKFTSSAQLTGALTLDAENDPDAQFVFEITSALTTAPASSVLMVRGGSPCNVYWQIGSDATLDTTTAFQGNLMALSSISLNNGATVQGRMLARNGQVSLINNVIDNSMCDAQVPPTPTPTPTPIPTPVPTATPTPPGGPTPPPGGPSGPGTPPGGPTGPGTPPAGSGTPLPPASGTLVPTRNGTAILRGSPRSPRAACTTGFTAAVRGHQIKRVVFRLDGKRIASRTGSPFRVHVRAAPGRHNVSARVTFKDATRAKTMNLGYRACAAAVLSPRQGPSQFTG